MWNRLRLLTLLTAILFLTSCNPEGDVTVMRLAHGLDTDHPVHRGMQFLADQIHEESEGKMEIVIYPNQQLGSEREILELLQIGSLDITKVSSSVLESHNQLFEILGVPFLFESSDHAYRVWDSEVGRELLDALQSSRLYGLAFYDAGARSFYTNYRPILHPDDLRGLSIRVQESPLAIRMVNLLGGSATPIAWGELYTALQQGIVNGAENNLPSLYLSRQYEVVEHLSLNEHTMVPDVLLINLARWERLSEQEQELIRDAAEASAEYQRKLWQEATAEALEGLEETGVTINQPEKEPFIEKMQPIYDEMNAAPNLSRMMDQIREMADG